MRRLALFLTLLVLVSGPVATWWWLSQEPAEEVFFRETLPSWFIDRVDGREAPDLTPFLERWPTLKPALDELDQAFGDPERTRTKAMALNPATEAAGLPYRVDVFLYGERPLLLTYRIEGRRTWRRGELEVEALRVRRLDRTNVVTSFLGHAGGDRPLILLDRLDAALLDQLRLVGSGQQGNPVDEAAFGHLERLIDARAGKGAFAEAVSRVKARDDLLDAMEKRLHNGRVRVTRPDRLLLGERYFDALQPYTELSGGRLPLILSVDLQRLKEADRAISQGAGAKAIEAALELDALLVEAHEVHHALGLDPTPGVIPEPLLAYVGDNDMDFAAQADQELRAYFGELHDGQAPACLGVIRIGRSAGGAHARPTPHHFAAVTLLKELTGKDPAKRSAFAPLIDELCALDEATLDQRLEAAWKKLYGVPWVSLEPQPPPAP